MQKKSLSLSEIRQLELLTVAEFGRLFNISPRSVYNLIDAGTVKRVKVGSLARIHQSQIVQYSRYLNRISGHKGGSI
jgi:excisionase family DNA binding protein